MALTWADKRRTYIIGGAIALGIMLLSGIGIAVMYEAPSCTDGRQNQDETGIDCGGSCDFLCRNEVQAPRLSFARAVTNGSGRTDVIAYIENRNQDAEAKDAPYTVEVFDESGTLLGKREGRIDLPARSTVALYVPGVYVGIGATPRAFVSFEDDMRWRNARSGETPLAISNITLIPGMLPRVNATVSNAAPSAVYGRILVATVFNSEGVAIAASQTVVREVPGQGSAQAVFTWPEAFMGTAVRVEVTAVPLLP